MGRIKSTIVKIEGINAASGKVEVSVSLSGMRVDLSQGMIIVPSDIKKMVVQG